MLATLTLVVLVSTGDAQTAASLRSAAQAVLGEQAQIEVRAVEPVPPEAERARWLEAEHVDVLVTLEWVDAERRHARLELRRAGAQPSVSREVAFEAADSEDEKARTLGLAIASTVLAEVAPPKAAEATTAPSPLPAPAAPAPPPPAPTSQPSPSPVPAQTPPPPAPPSSAASARALPRAEPSIDLAGQAILAPSGAGSRGGGSLGGQVLGPSHFGLRLDVALGLGHIHELGADLVVLDLAPGLVVVSGDAAHRKPLAFEFQWTLGARYLSVVRRGDFAQPAEQHGRFLPATRLTSDIVYWFASDFALFGAVGFDAAFGRTDVYAHGQRVARLEPFAFVAQVGLRAAL